MIIYMHLKLKTQISKIKVTNCWLGSDKGLSALNSVVKGALEKQIQKEVCFIKASLIKKNSKTKKV